MADDNTHVDTTKPLLSDQLYKALKFAALIVLPAFGTLYFGIAGIWHLPYADEVVGTVVCLETFFGIVLGISKRSYDKSEAKFDGALNVSGTAEDPYSFTFDTSLPDLASKDEIALKVKRD